MIQSVALVLMLATGLQAQPAPSGALRIVVVEGEDAVNIIQQKTAVRPLVEVRDRNNLPVSGALVTFSIPGGASTFGGATTLTVATNAAGQAAVTGLTPSVAGAFQIQVSAAFQGQLATATIAQTNVMTAAQAVAAGAASTGGSAGGAGGGAGGGGAAAGGAGGLSTTTLVVAGAAVAAGGAVAASQLGDKGSEESFYTGSFSGTINGTIISTAQGSVAGTTCTYVRSVSATARLKFQEESDTAVRGKFEYEGTDAIISTTCPGAGTTPTPPSFVGHVDLSGSPSRFSGRNQFATPNSTGLDGGIITGEHIYTFEGALTGGTATGTFRYEQKSQSSGGNAGAGLVQQLAVGTFTISFGK